MDIKGFLRSMASQKALAKNTMKQGEALRAKAPKNDKVSNTPIDMSVLDKKITNVSEANELLKGFSPPTPPTNV